MRGEGDRQQQIADTKGNTPPPPILPLQEEAEEATRTTF